MFTYYHPTHENSGDEGIIDGWNLGIEGNIVSFFLAL